MQAMAAGERREDDDEGEGMEGGRAMGVGGRGGRGMGGLEGLREEATGVAGM